MDARNKRHVTESKTDEGISILHRLIATCDVYITNMPLPLRRQLLLCYDDIAHLNESMVYASLTPYGEEDLTGITKPSTWWRIESVRANGQDALARTRTVQAIAGMGDHPTAVSMYASIVTALLRRERTGKGGFARTSLLANGVWSASCPAQGRVRFRRLFGHTPSGVHGCTVRDRRWAVDAAQYDPNGGIFDQMVVALEAIDMLTDERFATPESRMEHGDALTTLLREIFKQKHSDEWLQLLKHDHGLPIERVCHFL